MVWRWAYSEMEHACAQPKKQKTVVTQIHALNNSLKRDQSRCSLPLHLQSFMQLKSRWTEISEGQLQTIVVLARSKSQTQTTRYVTKRHRNAHHANPHATVSLSSCAINLVRSPLLCSTCLQNGCPSLSSLHASSFLAP